MFVFKCAIIKLTDFCDKVGWIAILCRAGQYLKMSNLFHTQT